MSLYELLTARSSWLRTIKPEEFAALLVAIHGPDHARLWTTLLDDAVDGLLDESDEYEGDR